MFNNFKYMAKTKKLDDENGLKPEIWHCVAKAKKFELVI